MKFGRRRLIVFSVLAALLIGITVLVYVQRNNLRAFLISMRYSEEELISLQEQRASDLLKQYGLDPILPAPADTITSPSVSSENADMTQAENTNPNAASDSVAIPSLTPGLIPEAFKPRAASQGKQESPVQLPQQQPNQERTEALPKDVQSLVYSLHTLQSQYLGQLEGIRASSLAQYKALPREERTTTKRISIVKAGVSQALSLEKQCDGRVASILRELRTTLEKHGLDNSVADNAEGYYANQKSLIKAEYMRKYNKYLK